MSGLNYNEAKQYWQERSSQQKELTVGFGSNKTIAAQDDEYNTKINFVKPYLDIHLPTLDYGCGIGRWSHLFNNYLGVDLTENLINIARERHVNKKYLLLEEPTLTTLDFHFSQFFTSTVLQHCDDNLVSCIIKSLYNLKHDDLNIILYENTHVQASHVNGRSPETYKNMFERYFKIKAFEFNSHYVHGEEHSVTSILI